MNHKFTLPIILILTTFSSHIYGCKKEQIGCGKLSTWYDKSFYELRIQDEENKWNAKWVISADKNTNDHVIVKDENLNGKITKGTLAIISGRAMITKGLELKPGYEIDAADVPGLMLQLLLNILGQVAPDGPKSVDSELAINHTEEKKSIRVGTSSASGVFGVPWTAQGSLKKSGAGSITYNLSFTSPLSKDTTYKISMSGEVANKKLMSLTDDMSLEGWKVHMIGPHTKKSGTSTILDYGAQPEGSSVYSTLGDIREYFRAQDHPGHLDSSKDFTGFWKENCDQAFGLQIMHYGNDGKYSVVFCGPGGCGEPSDSRLTYITGDKKYEIMSEDKLIEISRSGDRETYIRCTKDTHPVLKYKN